MTIIIGRILFSIMNKPVKFKIKPIAPSFNSVFSFFLNHLRITAICKYTKPNSIIFCADINKKPHECDLSGVCISVTHKMFKRKSIYQPVAMINIIKTITPINSLA